MILPLDKFNGFSSTIRITSKEFEEPVPLIRWGTQDYFLRELQAGLEDDVHDFVTLKGGRQEGITTFCLAFGAWWLQLNLGMQGVFVAESEANQIYGRDVVRDIVKSAPARLRRPVEIDHALMLKWVDDKERATRSSRLMFAHAAKRAGVRTSLGRSRGLNFIHATEVGSWIDDNGVSSLQAAMSERHPLRLAIWESTADGYGVFHDMWKTAEKAVTQRAVFIGWWLHTNYQLDSSNVKLWRAYAIDPPSSDEALWMREVKMRYGIEITMAQLGWYRWQLIEKFRGDEMMLSQEFGCLPELCFQSFGNRFMSTRIVQSLRGDLTEAPGPQHIRYDFGPTLDMTETERVESPEAPLTIWEEPDPEGVYIVAAHPQYSSSPEADLHVVQVFRAWPDRLIQVAEYIAHEGATFQFAWVVVHLCGAYAQRHAPGLASPYLIVELLGPGMAVFEELVRLDRYGWGLSTKMREKGREVLDILGSIRHFLHTRPDSLRGNGAWQQKTSTWERPVILNKLRDSIERGVMTIRSGALVDELAALRQGGEQGTADNIGGSGTKGDSRTLCAALANKMYLDIIGELEELVMPAAPSPTDPTHAAEIPVRDFFASMVLKYGA